MATLGIDTTQYERSEPTGGTVLPPGVYTMTVVRVMQKQTKDKTGVYLEVEFDISSPAQYGNRKFWDRFNIINKSPKAQQIGKECISELAKSCGIHGIVGDDQELLGKTVQGKLVVKPSTNPQYPDPKNECSKYYPLGANTEGTSSSVSHDAPKANSWAAAPAAAPVSPTSSGLITPPWKTV